MTSSQTSHRWPGILLLLALLVLSFLAPKRWDNATLEHEEQGLTLNVPPEAGPQPIPLARSQPSQKPGSDHKSLGPEETAFEAEPEVLEPADSQESVAVASQSGKAQSTVNTEELPSQQFQQTGPSLLLVPAVAESAVSPQQKQPLVAPEPSEPSPLIAAGAPRENHLPVRPGGTLSLARPVGNKVPAPEPQQAAIPQPAQAAQGNWLAVPPGLRPYLEAIASGEATSELLEQVTRCSGELYHRVRRGEEIEELCQQQRHLEKRLVELAESQTPEAAAALRRLAHALARRRVLWQSVDRLRRWQQEQRQLARRQTEALLASALELEQALYQAGAEEAWQRFLLLPELKQRAQAPSAEERQWSRLVAEFLSRVGTLRRDPQYERLPQWEQLRQLQRQLCTCALGRFRVTQLPEVVEQFEQTGDEVSRAALVQYLQLVEHAAAEAVGSQPRELVNHWNNTNVRLAIHNRLLAQLVPQAPPRWQQVYDTILGIPVRGRSWSTTRVDVRTLPGPGARLVITARGLVRSWTRASQGIVTTRERTVARFSARRLVQLHPQGVRSWPTRLELQARSELDELETELDGIPLLGDLVREIALSRREELLPEAQAEARWKLRRRIQAQFAVRWIRPWPHWIASGWPA